MTVAEIYTQAFIEAIEISVYKALGIMSISDVIVIPRELDSKWATTDYGFSYTVNVTSGLTPSEVISQLKYSMGNGDFLESLKDNSGVAISSINSTTFADVTPKYLPMTRPSLPPAVSTKRPSVSSSISGDLLLQHMQNSSLLSLLLVSYRFPSIFSFSTSPDLATIFYLFFLFYFYFINVEMLFLNKPIHKLTF